MTEAKKESSKRKEALLNGLFSTQPEAVRSALKKIPDAGDARMVIPLLKTYNAWEDAPDIQADIEAILKQIKTEAAIPELIIALEDPQFDANRALIISVFWHAGIYPVSDFDILVKHAIRGDFMVTLEVITVIENMDTALDVELLRDSLFDIDDFLDAHPDAPHAELLNQLKHVLNTYTD